MWREVPWTAFDLETTGLDPSTDAILSIGLVDIDGGRIRLGTTWPTLVRPPPGTVFRAEPIRVHGILPRDVAAAPLLGDVLPKLLHRLAGRVPIAHMGLDLDAHFLDRALRTTFGIGFATPLLDTARLADRLDDIPELRFRGPGAARSSRLTDLAVRFGIPVEREHDALADALVCAQLFLVLATRLEGLGRATGSRLLKAM